MHDPVHRTRSLWLIGSLHAFTHVYNVALLPLYLEIQADLHLANVGQATLLVTVMMLVYSGLSYGMGRAADRCDRRQLLGWGLALNAAGFLGLGFAPNFATALACVVVAGVGGSFFHPAATALIVRLYPEATGRALGRIAIGASVGFFSGPLYAGWAAAHFGSWRAPVIHLGLLGLAFAGVFFWLAPKDAPTPSVREAQDSHNLFPTPALWALFLGAALLFSLRDFAGASMGTLGSLFLQQVHGFDLKQTGLALSGIFLASVVSNPLFGHLSDRGRKRWTALVLVCSAVLMAAVPHLPRVWLLPAFLLYGFFFLACYPMVEALLMDAVPDAIRGRVFGLWITVGGVIGNLAHWIAGSQVKRLGQAAHSSAGYFPLYAGLAGLILISLAGLPCLAAIRRREAAAQALAANPATHRP